jgi:hypothetical protein
MSYHSMPTPETGLTTVSGMAARRAGGSLTNPLGYPMPYTFGYPMPCVPDLLAGPYGKGYPRGKKTAVWGVARPQGV